MISGNARREEIDGMGRISQGGVDVSPGRKEPGTRQRPPIARERTRPVPPPVPGDQAEGLRRLMQDRGVPPDRDAPGRAGTSALRPLGARSVPLARRAKVIAVVSGKGGVGKTNLAVNLALAAARRAPSAANGVALVDADLGLANADVLLDLSPEFNLSHVLAGERTVEEVAVPVRRGLDLVPGASGLATLANLDADGRARLRGAVESLEARYDLVVVDAAAGIAENVISLAAAADEVLVVSTCEPTSVMDAYAAVKLVAERSRLSGVAGAARLSLAMNMAASRRRAERVAGRLISTARRFLGVRVGLRGVVLRDRAVRAAVERRRPFVELYPCTPAASGVRAMARTLLGWRPAGAGRASHARRGTFWMRFSRAMGVGA